MSDHPKFARGGYIPGTVPITLDPEECIVRAADVKAGNFVCCRASHAGRPCHEPALIPRDDASQREPHCESCGGPCRDETDMEGA